jgi:hypothetical protein
LMRGVIRQAELLRVVGFEGDGHDVWVPFGFLVFWFLDTKKPGLGEAGRSCGW